MAAELILIAVKINVSRVGLLITNMLILGLIDFSSEVGITSHL